MVSSKTLKLDMSFRPIEVIDAIEALVLCLVGKAQAIESHTLEINSVNSSFKLPSVIALKRIVKFHFKTMACKRQNVIWRDQNQCQYCGNKFCIENLTIDHILPRSKGGKNTWKNLVTACKKCNQKKGNKTPEQANMFLIRTPFKPKTNILRNVNKNQINPIWKNYLWENYDE
jgi:5-methylcytosine-specific restriction endonuclease McrA